MSHTILTPIGGYMIAGFFGINELIIPGATVLEGVESTLLLVGMAIFVLCVLWGLLKWQEARQ